MNVDYAGILILTTYHVLKFLVELEITKPDYDKLGDKLVTDVKSFREVCRDQMTKIKKNNYVASDEDVDKFFAEYNRLMDAKREERKEVKRAKREGPSTGPGGGMKKP